MLKKSLKKVTAITTLMAIILAISACGGSSNKNSNPHTGDPNAEFIIGNLVNRSKVVVGKTYYVISETLYVRSSDEINDHNILGKLEKNDPVTILDNSSSLNKEFVEVEIVQSVSKIAVASKYFVSYKYLDSKIPAPLTNSRYFIIQNVATERLRIYERICPDGSCAENRLVMETPIAAGENESDRRTLLGSYYISEWFKFYQDQNGLYPSWYDDSLPSPMPPGVGSPFFAWEQKKYLRKGQSEGLRGAFGWYTAIMAPNPAGQWLHGTIGHGDESRKFIRSTKKFLLNVISDPRSHGCSRTSNEAIAFIRQIVEAGTPVVKIYARESNRYDAKTLQQMYSQEELPWNYILTKNGQRVDGQKADALEVQNSGVLDNDILEKGTYLIDAYPNPVPFSGIVSVFGTSSNIYKVSRREFHGLLFADAGVVCQYRHPESLSVAGKTDELVPQYMTIEDEACAEFLKNNQRRLSHTSPDRVDNNEPIFDNM